MSDSWTTTSGPQVKDSLRQRALKRDVHQVTYNKWIVTGDPKLGDSYDQYVVRLPASSTRLECDCRNHYGGEFRKLCSHLLATIYYRNNHPDTDDDYPQPREESSRPENSKPVPETLPSATVRSDPPQTDPSFRPTAVPVEIVVPDTPTDLPASQSESPVPFPTFRDHQPPAIAEVMRLFKSGVKVVMLEAPTGTGKTLISESVRRMNVKDGIYTCTTKTLQDQVARDFDYARILKGRSNYPTYDDPNITAEICNKSAAQLPACPGCDGWDKGSSWDQQPETWEDESSEAPSTALHCHFCHPPHQCAYEQAKAAALSAPLAVLNLAYLLAEANGPAKFSKQDLIILDEADMLESELMSYVEVVLTKKKRDWLGCGEPQYITKEESWIDWIENRVLPAVENERKGLLAKKKRNGPTPTILKGLRSNKNLADKLAWLISEGEDGDANLSGWVLDRDNYDKFTFKPVRVSEFAQQVLWNHSQKFLLMSATIVSAEQMASDLGLKDGEWAMVNVPSTFPIERRPIALDTIGTMNRDSKETTYPAAARRVVDLMRKHPNERILVHTVSYELNGIILKAINKTPLRSRAVTYFKAADREGALARYLDMDNGVLLSPSFERGVDLPHDACRIVIVTKMPFPYLGDKQIKARTYGTHDGRMWYAVQTIRALCQMTGRGMRSADDWCISYILDSSFHNLYGPNRRLFPEWWSEAVVWDENDPMWRDSVLHQNLILD